MSSVIKNLSFPDENEEETGEKWNEMVFLPSPQGCYDTVGTLSLWRKRPELDCGKEAARRV